MYVRNDWAGPYPYEDYQKVETLFEAAYGSPLSSLGSSAVIVMLSYAGGDGADIKGSPWSHAWTRAPEGS